MALLKYDNANAGYPQCLLLHGSFIAPASPAYNLQVVPALQPLTQPRTSGAQVSCSINPVGLRVNVFCAPFLGQPTPATNTSGLPQGMAPGAISPIGSEFLLDLSAFPADIASCEVDICKQARNSVQNDVQASFIDTVNKLIYLQVVAFTSGAATVPGSGSVISFQVAFKDTLGV